MNIIDEATRPMKTDTRSTIVKPRLVGSNSPHSGLHSPVPLWSKKNPSLQVPGCSLVALLGMIAVAEQYSKGNDSLFICKSL